MIENMALLLYFNFENMNLRLLIISAENITNSSRQSRMILHFLSGRDVGKALYIISPSNIFTTLACKITSKLSGCFWLM